MDNLEPITRNEMFLNGDDLEPITREEMILAGEDLEPITRHEWFLKKYRGGGGGGGYDLVNIPNLPADIASFNDGTDLPMASLKVAVTPYQDLHGYDGPWAGGAGKNIALVDAETTQKPNYYDGSWNIGGLYGENGFIANRSYNDGGGGGFALPIKSGSYVVSFEAEQGKATSETYRMIMLGYDSTYSRIGNNISITTSGNSGKYSFTVSLVEGTAFAVVRIAPNSWASGVTPTAWINKIQIESGSTSTTYEPYSNICPIIGWDEAVVTVADDTESPTTSHEYTIDLDGTRYGGVVDATNGTMTVDRVMVTVDENSAIISGSGGLPFRIDLLTGAKASSSASALTGVKCNFLKEVAQSSSWGVDGTFSRVTTDAKIVYFKVNSEITTVQQLKTFLQSNNLQFVYELAIPTTVQLAQTPVKSIEGENNISANCGQITEVKYFKKA